VQRWLVHHFSQESFVLFPVLLAIFTAMRAQILVGVFGDQEVCQAMAFSS